jgi:hypothetical protein
MIGITFRIFGTDLAVFFGNAYNGDEACQESFAVITRCL